MPGDIASRNIKVGAAGRNRLRARSRRQLRLHRREADGHAEVRLRHFSRRQDRVKYGEENGEVYSEVAATRLLWALGFGADRVYPVKVVCNGCPEDPMKNSKKVDGTREFAAAIVERKLRRRRHRAAQGFRLGMGRAQFRRPDERRRAAGASRRAEAARGDDSAHRQQAPAAAARVPRQSARPAGPERRQLHASVHDDQRPRQDVRAGDMYNADKKSAVNFEAWSSTPIWKDERHAWRSCRSRLPDRSSIRRSAKSGRKFLADLLAQLTDQQLRDLFEVARFTKRDPKRLGRRLGQGVQAEARRDRERPLREPSSLTGD